MKDFTLDYIKQLIHDPSTYDPAGHDFLDNRYQDHIAQGGNHLYYRLFYHLARFLQPNFTVELGGWQGTAAAHLASGWPLGTVITIDHHTDLGDEANRERMLEAETKCNNLQYIQGWTNDILAEREKGNHTLGDAPSALSRIENTVFSKRFPDKMDAGIDILFIDSWHKYEEAMLDWKAYKPLLASPSLVICDDMMIGYDAPAISGMGKFWDKLPKPKFLDATAHPGYPMGFLKYE